MIRCGAVQPGSPPHPRYCTRELNHPDDHVATIGPYEAGGATLARWPSNPKSGDHSDDIGFDSRGVPLPHAPSDVREIMDRMLDRGEIVAAVVKDTNGDYGVSVFGPPTRELLNVLESTTAALRMALKPKN
jgi:hypothetical protein